MKQLTAVIQPVKLGPVREALSLVGVTGMTITDVRGFGSQGGSVDTYRGVEYRVDYVSKIQIDIVVSDNFVEQTIDAVIEAARTDTVGDGKIWIRDVDAVVRVRTGERDEIALS